MTGVEPSTTVPSTSVPLCEPRSVTVTCPAAVTSKVSAATVTFPGPGRTGGVLSREPIRTGAASSAANGALDAFTMAAAVELPRGIRINCVSPTVLVEAPAYHPSFPGFTQVGAAAVGLAYVKAVEGVQTGQVYALDGQ